MLPHADVALDHAQRIAVLENQVQDLRLQNGEIVSSVQEISEKLDTLLRENARYKGTIGGILLAFTGLMVTLTFIKDWGAKLLKLL